MKEVVAQIEYIEQIVRQIGERDTNRKGNRGTSLHLDDDNFF